MDNVKNKLLPILCLALCLCIVWSSTTTAHASDVINVLNAKPQIGDDWYYECINTYTLSTGVQYKEEISATCKVTNNNQNIAFYIYNISDSQPSGIYGWCASGSNATSPDKVYMYTTNLDNGNISQSTNPVAWSSVRPLPYVKTSNYADFVTVKFDTNVPIFSDRDTALAYQNGSIGIERALNYNKVLENGSWVAPFEDIEINDNEVDLPKVSNLSHQGFTLTNNPTEKGYLIELYVENGLRDPINFENNSLGKPLLNPIQGFSHTYGLLDPVGDAYNYQTVFDLLADYGIDNVGNLTQACREFYSAYPSANSYDRLLQSNKNTWAVWGQPFGKNFVFWNSNSSVSVNDISSVTCNTCPLAFTTYKIRYFYYDDTSGWHYGPWSVYTYFTNGEIAYSSVYQDDEDKILETDTTYGEQDNSGNVVVNTSGFNASQFVDLNNPNELFGYIRSVTNNVTATMGNFSMLFATVFTFIPADIQGMIWFGIAVMVVIGVIKVIKG